MRSLYEAALSTNRDLGRRPYLAADLEGMGTAAALEGRLGRAVRLWSAGSALRASIGTARPPNDHDEYDRQLARARQEFGGDAFAAAWEAGQAMTAAEAVAYALDRAA